MNIREYRWRDPAFRGPGGRDLRALGHPERIERLVSALEAFVDADTTSAFRVAPELHGGPVEVFAVPPPTDLARLPDALALVRVDHPRRTLDLVAVFREVGGRDGLWQQITEAAQAALT